VPELAHIPHGDQITIRQLLNHTSGIGGEDFVEGTLNYFNFTPSEMGQTLAERLKVLKQEHFAPDTDWQYSSGPDLAGVAMARAAGKSSAYQVMKDEILVPLGLQNTYLDDKPSP